MTKTLHTYQQQFNIISGSDTAKVKTLIAQNMDQWFLEDESIVIDLLDDPTITTGEIMDILSDMVACEEGNAEFKEAVLAMHLCLEKARLNQVNLIDAEALNVDEDHEEHNIFSFCSIKSNVLESFALAG